MRISARQRLAKVVTALISSVVIVGVPATAVTFTAGIAAAESVADYPEFPYAATNYTEPLRGQFHFTPPNGWMNDVNGPVYYRGTYHMFFQHNPHALDHGPEIHWGHATSTDLVHWTQKPIALEPGVINFDLASGSGWVDVNNVTGLKTGSDDPILMFANTGGVSIAYSTDGAQTFKNYNNGAKVITTPYESRDPKVQWDPGHNRWELVLYANNGGNGANFYTSSNLLTWTYAGRFSAPWFFECPDLYQLRVDGTGVTKWVLQNASGDYVLGQLDINGMFVSDTGTSQQRMDMGTTNFGGTWYAAQTFNQMPNGRAVQMAWQPGNHGQVWTGNASFPVDVALKTFPEGIRVTRNPVGEISGIRSGTQTWGTQTVSPSTDLYAGIAADTYEIQAEFDVTGSTASEFGFQLHRRADASSDRTVPYVMGAQTLYGNAMPAIGGRVKVRLLVDRGQLEIFGNDGKLVVSDNVNFNSAASSQGIRLYATGGSVALVSMTFSRLNSIFTATPGGGMPNRAIAFTINEAKCLDRDVASGRVQIYDCLGNANQAWTLNADATLTTGGACMQLPAGQIANFTLVSVATCAGGSNQKWSKGNNGSIINQASGRCLDLDSGNQANLRQLQVYDCLVGPNQSWVGPAGTAATAPAGAIRWTGNVNKCLDRDVASGRVQIFDCLGNGNQTWTLNTDGSLATGGVCMETPGVSPSPNFTLVQVYACNGGSNQKWSRGANGSFINQLSNRCLDLANGDATNLRQLQVYDCVGGPNQAWSGPA